MQPSLFSADRRRLLSVLGGGACESSREASLAAAKICHRVVGADWAALPAGPDSFTILSVGVKGARRGREGLGLDHRGEKGEGGS